MKIKNQKFYGDNKELQKKKLKQYKTIIEEKEKDNKKKLGTIQMTILILALLKIYTKMKITITEIKKVEIEVNMDCLSIEDARIDIENNSQPIMEGDIKESEDITEKTEVLRIICDVILIKQKFIIN